VFTMQDKDVRRDGRDRAAVNAADDATSSDDVTESRPYRSHELCVPFWCSSLAGSWLTNA